jgi:6-phosphogluconate dehydrogenase
MTGATYDIGMVGLGVMGRNLALNMAEKGFSVVGYDTDPAKVEALGREGAGKPAAGVASVEALAAALRLPRAVMMLVPAGPPVDAVIDALLPYLDAGDVLLDGGNSHFRQTEGRAARLEGRGIFYMGVGVSGGEAGARKGPSIMPGGPQAAWARVRPILEAAAAKVDGEPCVAWLGPSSAGDYVKMVHNGIEYAVMQAIAEVYDLMKRGLGLADGRIGQVFDNWNAGALPAYLIEITGRVLAKTDAATGRPLVEAIVDEAAQKGTGMWTAQDAMELRAPVPAVDAAVSMRDLSDLRTQRIEAARVLAAAGPAPGGAGGGNTAAVGGRDLTTRASGLKDAAVFIGELEAALRASMVLIYSQGMAQLRAASAAYGYGLKLKTVAQIWRGGCIIRSWLLEHIRAAFSGRPDLPNLLLDPVFAGMVAADQAALRSVVVTAAQSGIPAPAITSCLAYLDAYRSARLPANLIQAQRDYFGAHTYRRLDKEGSFHTEWE